jgi:hypothetical protein
MASLQRPTLTLDAGALIAIERNDATLVKVLAVAVSDRIPILIPAGALAQAWRGTSRQARIAKMLQDPAVNVVPLDEPRARLAGVICGRSKTKDVVDASVVLCARENRSTIVTSDPDDIQRVDASARVIAI